MNIYSVGCLTYLDKTGELDHAIEWRTKLSNWCKDNNVKIFNPSETYLNQANHECSSDLIVKQNDYYLNKCDIAVVDLYNLKYSPGSIYELTRLKEMGKPVIAFGNYLMSSPHVRVCIDDYVETIEDVMVLLSNLFHQNNF